jgi:hypothetical protein
MSSILFWKNKHALWPITFQKKQSIIHELDINVPVSVIITGHAWR